MEAPEKPISVDDIDRAPSSLPTPPNTNWEMRYHEVSREFTKISSKEIEQREEIHRLKQKINTHNILDDLIKPSASNAFKFMVAYCGFVGAVLILSGFRLWGFSLGDHVLETLVGSTAVTVIGLVGMVLTGVFVGARGK